ncbi:MAG: hypothetical protein K8R88_00495 [Armatimonadetes bacterium]|nr:hypothetical protein [Armatimonadota bacterium]
MRGNEASLIIIDEAAFVPHELITEVAMPMLATTEGDLVMISTPNGQNHFWRYFRMGERGEHGIWAKQAPSSDNPMISADFLATQKELISERAYRVEYEAAFLDSSGRVFSAESIDGCLVPEDKIVAEGPFYIGVDWARYKDYTAIVVLCQHQGKANLVFAERFTGIVWSAQIDRVVEIIQRFPQAQILTDNTGVGDPVLEQLIRAMPHSAIQGLVFNQRIKGDLIDSLRLSVERGLLRMAPNPELLREMENFESRNGKLEAVGGYNDDLVIALSLANRILPKSYGIQILLGDIRRFAVRRILKPLTRFAQAG